MTGGGLPDMPPPAVVCLDVGEVLIDETRVWAAWAEVLGVSPFALHATIGAAIAGCLPGPPAPGAPSDAHLRALHHLAGDRWRSLGDEVERRYGGFRPDDLYHDVLPAIAVLRARGSRVIVAGNQPARRTRELLDLGVTADLVVTSDELGVAKPEPAFFTAVLERAGVTEPSSVLYVGDRWDNDVVPAARAGLATAWLRRGPWALLQPRPDGTHPDLVLGELGELPAALASWRTAT